MIFEFDARDSTFTTLLLAFASYSWWLWSGHVQNRILSYAKAQ